MFIIHDLRLFKYSNSLKIQIQQKLIKPITHKYYFCSVKQSSLNYWEYTSIL